MKSVSALSINSASSPVFAKSSLRTIGGIKTLILNDCDELTLIHEAVRKRRVIVLRSFTKSFSIPGLRLGYLIGHKETVSILKDSRDPWGINSLACAAGCEAARDFMY